ncbi:hypothetical protein [Moraxella lacunata]|uniref:hypothetical protein n=1 Tax=Moraxella lacunata TaxID=477 RepID=UPI003EE397AC
MFFIVKNLSDRITINLRFFLEKRAIFLIFHCKYQSSTRPIKAIQKLAFVNFLSTLWKSYVKP